MLLSEAMATIFPNPKLFSRSLLDSRGLLPHSCSHFTLIIDGYKPVRASSSLSCRPRDCGVTYLSRWRCLASTSGAFVVEKEEEDDNEMEEEEGEEDFVPLREMTRWMQNKPAGFGEGRTYDTAVEDNILEEMERSRANQLEEKRKPRISAKDNGGSIKKQAKQNGIGCYLH